MPTQSTKTEQNIIDSMFKAGAHYGFAKTRRHPSMNSLIFGVKNKVEIFDLEKTKDFLTEAKEYVTSVASDGGVILFVSGKHEAKEILKNVSKSIDVPFVAGRWIGGTLTNFSEIRKRVNRMEDLISQREKGELSKYTKKERLLIDREIEKLSNFFGGIASMKSLPKALFIIDPRFEKTAIAEAHIMDIPTVALCGSDCNLSLVDFSMPGNDASRSSITFFINEIAESYKKGKEIAEVNKNNATSEREITTGQVAS